MAKGLGSNPGRNFGPVDAEVDQAKAKGIYPDKESGAGEYGSTNSRRLSRATTASLTTSGGRWARSITALVKAGATDRSMFGSLPKWNRELQR